MNHIQEPSHITIQAQGLAVFIVRSLLTPRAVEAAPPIAVQGYALAIRIAFACRFARLEVRFLSRRRIDEHLTGSLVAHGIDADWQPFHYCGVYGEVKVLAIPYTYNAITSSYQKIKRAN